MPSGDVSVSRFLRLSVFLFVLFVVPFAVRAQNSATPSRIVQRVNEENLVTLRGNTHPLARRQFDQGAAPPDLPMARMLLILKRSDALEAALGQLLDAQQDKNSPSYHQWLTPDQFGQQFGPSDQDLQTIRLWLGLHGFQIIGVSRGRTVIEFSGTAGQVQQAFHTEIHKYTVNGQEHWANASDPQIPAALAPVILGINSLHNFTKRPLYHLAGKSLAQRAAIQGIGGETTIADQNFCGGPCYFLSPYDFATIYNVLPLWNKTPAIDGTGQAIAIINRTNINIQDVRDFRNLFGLPANDPQVILNGPDPGLVPNDETEADLDVEWSGAVATGATVNLVIAQTTSATDGVDLAALYAVENNVAPVMSESFGECELFLGTAGNSFANALRQQAAAQGITYMTSTGDQGSALCDASDDNFSPSPATQGLSVNGLASTPYGVAVGGTDFLNFGSTYNIAAPSPYWSSSNDPLHQASALGYVPETTWNDSCTNNIWVFLRLGSTPEAACNNVSLQSDVLVAGGSGGKSSCTASDGANELTCSGHYAKPSWQSAPGVPADSARDLPDVSLFASNGFMSSSYILCESDVQSGKCSLAAPLSTFVAAGGTSASSPAFAGIMALVNQATGSSGQGNANYVLYALAASSKQTSVSCGATSSPAAGCIFYDVTNGTIAMPCAAGSLNCTVTNSGDLFGVLAGYSATSGYDQATGLGSVNAANMVQNWIQPANSSNTTLTLNGGNPVNITHGQSVPFNITVTPSAAPGVVAMVGSPSGGGFVPLGSFTLQNGSASGNTSALAGGTSYAVKAHYPGNGTYGPSDSAPVTVTVAPEPSKTLITIPVFDPNTGAEIGNTPSSIFYGTPMGLRVDVGNASATTSFPMKPVCAVFICPTGNVTVMDSYNGGGAAPLGGSGIFTLNSEGYAEDDGILLSGGTHQISANYAGDTSYKAGPGTYSLTVTPAPTQASAPATAGPVLANSQLLFGANISTNVFQGAAPTGTITFYDGTTPISGTVTLNGTPGTSTTAASLFGYISASFATSGTHQITARYSGDSNYAGSTSPATPLSVLYPTTAAETASSASINVGSSVTVTATVTSTFKSPAISGTFQFSSASNIGGPVTPTLSTDASGNQVLTASVTTALPTTNFVGVQYSGDQNYEAATASVFVTVITPSFNIGVSPPLVAITAGQSGSAQVTLSPTNSLSNSASLSCNTALAGVTCSFNPTTPLSLANGAPASATVMVATLPPSSALTTSSAGIRPPHSRRFLPPGLWIAALANALAALSILIMSGKRRGRLTVRFAFTGLLCLVLGCGSGGSTGAGGGGGSGGSGGGTGPSPTSITLSTSTVKASAGANVTFTATVSSKSATGMVNLIDSLGAIDSQPVVNGVATFQVPTLGVGTHVMSAQYLGDSNNQASRTNGAINVVITGTSGVYVIATSPYQSFSTQFAVTIQ